MAFVPVGRSDGIYATRFVDSREPDRSSHEERLGPPLDPYANMLKSLDDKDRIIKDLSVAARLASEQNQEFKEKIKALEEHERLIFMLALLQS